MPTHRIKEDVNQRMWEWALKKYGLHFVQGVTFNDVLDQLLKEAGF